LLEGGGWPINILLSVVTLDKT